MSPTENPWPLMFLLFCTVVGLGLAFARQQKQQYLLGGAVCLLLIPVLWLIDRQVTTTREEIANNVRDLTRAFQQKDMPRTLSHVSEQAPKLRSLILGANSIIELQDDMRVTDVQVELLAQEARARTRFRVNGTFVAHLPGLDSARDHVASRWEARWQKEQDQWKMFDIVELDPVSGQTMDRLDVVRFAVDKVYPDTPRR